MPKGWSRIFRGRPFGVMLGLLHIQALRPPARDTEGGVTMTVTFTVAMPGDASTFHTSPVSA